MRLISIYHSLSVFSNAKDGYLVANLLILLFFLESDWKFLLFRRCVVIALHSWSVSLVNVAGDGYIHLVLELMSTRVTLQN